jgi:signal transduction histidine kinase
MKNFFRTFYGKISLIFVVLLFTLGIIQIVISLQSSLNFVCETDQTINRPLAKNLAQKFQPLLMDSINYGAIEDIIHDIMIFNPRLDVYIVDLDGNIKAMFQKPGSVKLTKIKTKPIRDFISDSPEIPLPIVGDDPKDPGRHRVFSATEIDLGKDGKGYLYVILGAELFDSAITGIAGSYILGTTAFIFLVTLIFAGVLGSLMFFKLTKRLSNVTQTVKEFEKGNYNRRLLVKSDDEIGQLTTAFNRMAETIELNMEELKKNDTLRRELIANISHDLRSPLASIQGYIETILMKDDNIDSRQRKNFLETILTSVTNLNTLVAELFELSKLDAMKSKPTPEPFSIAELVQDIVLKFQPLAENKSIHIITKIPHSLPFVMGDISMIDRVLSNLIDNAIRYTGEGGRISIDLINREEIVELVISDTGEGIPSDDLPNVFDRFYRVEKSRTKNSGGSGLGLAIVKKIVEAHDSEIRVQSTINKGTAFSFTLKKHLPVVVSV